MPTLEKPAKPYPGYPLFAHATRRWAKKIAGKTEYFGPWDDPDGAEARYRARSLGNPNEPVIESPKPVSKPKPIQRQKPDKPNGSPLFAHGSGQWAKKIVGKTEYFGPWSDHQAALARYLHEKDDLLAGRRARPQSHDGISVTELANRFLNSKRALLGTELEQRTFDDYKKSCEHTLTCFGQSRLVADLTPDDFERLRTKLGITLGPVALGNQIIRIRSLFKYGWDQRLIPAPVHFGQTFKKPSRKVIRVERAKKGKRLFEPAQLREMIAKASRPLRAMILLGINCGYHNIDCARLPIRAVDLNRGWVEFGRPKTGIDRWCPLWQETISALKVFQAVRPLPMEDKFADLFFLTQQGRSWSDGTHRNPITQECTKLMQSLGFHRPGLNFQALRHTFQTIGEGTKDQKAVQFIMGHAPDGKDMSAVYREEMKEDRLRAVTDFIWSWMFT